MTTKQKLKNVKIDSKGKVDKVKAPKKLTLKKSTKPKKPHYVNAKELLQQIRDYYARPEGEEMIPELAINVSKIAKGLSFAPNFINYSYKDDMIGDAVVKMFTALQNQKFNCDAGNNPFSYFTTIAFHAFINRIKREKKYKEVVRQYQESVYEEIMGSDNDVETNQRVDYTNPYDSEQ